MQNDINYEALGRFTHLKQQREIILLQLRTMHKITEDFNNLLENARHNSCERLIKATENVTAIAPEILKLAHEAQAMTTEIKEIKAKYNIGASNYDF